MYKGYKRKVIVVKDANSRLFDSAYFVVREDAGEQGIHDMVEEAARIINEKIEQETCPSSCKRFLAFSLGGAFCSLLFTALVLLLT